MNRFLVGITLVFALACGDDDGTSPPDGMGGDAGPAACGEGQVCATLTVPESFDGTPREVFVGLYSSLPPAGPPEVFVGNVASPAIAAGMPMTMALDDGGASGDYHVFIALYVEGGGMFNPEPGIDYMATTAPVTFGAGPVELGEVALELAE